MEINAVEEKLRFKIQKDHYKNPHFQNTEPFAIFLKLIPHHHPETNKTFPLCGFQSLDLNGQETSASISPHVIPECIILTHKYMRMIERFVQDVGTHTL